MSTNTTSEQEQTGAEKVQQLRELFADAPELGKKALENALREISSQVSETPPRPWRAPAASAPASARSRS